jgi:hypothetical protein
MKRAALVPLLMAGAMTLTSAQADNVVNAVGFQQTSCGQWTQARASHQSAEMEFWAMGFVSGASFVRQLEVGTGILESATDAQAIYSRIVNYCRSKPLERFPSAAASLVIELRARARALQRD